MLRQKQQTLAAVVAISTTYSYGDICDMRWNFREHFLSWIHWVLHNWNCTNYLHFTYKISTLNTHYHNGLWQDTEESEEQRVLD